MLYYSYISKSINFSNNNNNNNNNNINNNNNNNLLILNENINKFVVFLI